MKVLCPACGNIIVPEIVPETTDCRNCPHVLYEHSGQQEYYGCAHKDADRIVGLLDCPIYEDVDSPCNCTNSTKVTGLCLQLMDIQTQLMDLDGRLQYLEDK